MIFCKCSHNFFLSTHAKGDIIIQVKRLCHPNRRIEGADMEDPIVDKKNRETKEIEVDVKRLFQVVLNKAWLVIIVAMVAAVITLVSTVLFVTPTYQSSVLFYVNNSSFSVDNLVSSITSSDITASKGLVKSYMIILQTRETINDVIDYAEVDRSYDTVKNMIEAESVDATEIFKVVVTSEDPEEAAAIANAISVILPKRIDSIINGTSSKVVSAAVVPSAPSGPSYTTNTLIAFALGLLLTVAGIVVYELLDITIRREEDVTDHCKLPLLASIPDMTASSKKRNYAYHQYSHIPPSEVSPTDKVVLVGGKINFAAAEAYKMLRTKVQFSFADDADCHIIGVSSAMTGEGKSLSAVNLAYSMSQLGKRVLLIDCDMRRPSVAEKLPVQSSPGLSDYLSGQTRADNLIQHCGMEDAVCAFHVIAAGRIPPNPMELLSSNKMSKLLEVLRGSYDYIVLDLPPVGEVADALATVKLSDGMLLVVRQNYGNRSALNAAIRQFEFVNSRIVGVVLNCASDPSHVYGKYYRKYYRGSYYQKFAKAKERLNKRNTPPTANKE